MKPDNLELLRETAFWLKFKGKDNQWIVFFKDY